MQDISKATEMELSDRCVGEMSCIYGSVGRKKTCHVTELGCFANVSLRERAHKGNIPSRETIVPFLIS